MAGIIVQLTAAARKRKDWKDMSSLARGKTCSSVHCSFLNVKEYWLNLWFHIVRRWQGSSPNWLQPLVRGKARRRSRAPSASIHLRWWRLNPIGLSGTWFYDNEPTSSTLRAPSAYTHMRWWRLNPILYTPLNPLTMFQPALSLSGILQTNQR